ncbi:hypothetical protein [Clostridium baratii]|uniref:hypothetical protein n=1 Tax=Clostridium baratii TaxID=1561 RepID=UPI0030D36CA0
MENKILELLGEGGKIKTKEIDINNNILRLDKETIQLRNISQISIDRPKEKISNKVWILIILSFFISEINETVSAFLLLFSIGYIVLVFLKNENANYCLSIYQNSGEIYHILIKDECFLNKIREVLEECFNDLIKGANINIEKQTIEKQTIEAPITIGNNNSINNTKSNNNTYDNRRKYINNKIDNSSTIEVKNSKVNQSALGNNNRQTYEMENYTKYDWGLLENELEYLLNELPVSSDEYIACKNMLEVVKEKNENLFNRTLIKYKKQFTSQLFLNTASTILSRIILNIIGVDS